MEETLSLYGWSCPATASAVGASSPFQSVTGSELAYDDGVSKALLWFGSSQQQRTTRLLHHTLCGGVGRRMGRKRQNFWVEIRRI